MQDWYQTVTADDLPETHKKFLGILSPQQILALCEAFGGASVYIPKNDEVYNEVVRNRAIRKAYLRGVPLNKLAVRYGVSESTVTRVVHGYAPNQISMFDGAEEMHG